MAAIARLGTLTRAARELHVTPAALTARLKQLEGDIGLGLFDRTPAGLKITEAGREVLSAVENIKVIIDGCAERLDGLKGLSGGCATIGVVSTAKYFAPRIVAAFKQAHSGIDVRLLIGNRESTIRLLRDYEVDLTIMGRPPRDFSVEAEPFGKHPLVVVASPQNHLVRRKHLTKKDLIGETFLVREEGSGTRMVFEQFIGRTEVKRSQFGIEMGSNETIKQAVMADLGIALISAHTIAAEVESRRLAVLDIRGLPIWRQWFSVRRADKVLGPAAKAFWSFMVEENDKYLPRFRGSPA